MIEAEFYINRDSGYHALWHNRCDSFVAVIDAGDTLADLNTKAWQHVCPP